MADNKCKECLEVFSSFLNNKSRDYLAAKYKVIFKLDKFIKDLLEILCNSFTANYGAKTEDHFGEDNTFVSSFVVHIPVLFPCNIFFEVFKDYFEVLTNAGKDIGEVLKLCKIVLEVVKSCSLTWLLQVNETEILNLEMSHLDKAKKDIVALLLFLVKHIDLMSLNAEELNSLPKLNLVPQILLICHSVLQKLCESTEGISDIISRNLEASILKRIACDALMVAMQHTGRCYSVSEISRKGASGFLKFVIERCGCNDIEALLSGSDGKTTSNTGMVEKIFSNGLLGNILQSIKHFISKDKLIELPVVIHILVWSIKKVKHPFLGQHISLLMPPLLLLVDDYRICNRVTGIRTLEHVIENTNATELCWYGRAEVIYEALHHRIHTNEPEVMQVLQPCLLKILKVIEPSPKKPTLGRNMNKCDQNFQIILSAMEFESKIALRRAYCNHLVEFIDHMGITVLRHFKRLLRVVFRYLEIPDGETEGWRVVMLDVLKAIVTNAWSRIPSHSDEILRSLLKLVVDVSTSCVGLIEVKQNIMRKIQECLLLLLFCCGEPVKGQLEPMTTGLGHIETEELISRTLHCYKTQIK